MKHLSLFTFFLATLFATNICSAERLVSVTELKDLAFNQRLQFPASAINLQVTDIAVETTGRIIDASIIVGDKVKKGQVLIKIDCKALRINQKRFQAGAKRLQAKKQLTVQQLNRAKRLVSSRSISREELDQRQTQLDADNASIDEQQALIDSGALDISHCILKAPFSGTIVRKQQTLGAYVVTGTPVLRLLKEDAIEVSLKLPSKHIKQIKQAADIHFEDNSIRYDLTLRKVLPVIDPASKQQLVRLSVNADTKPAGGSFGLVRFTPKQQYLPSKYIQKREGQLGIFTLNDGKAIFHPIDNAEEGQAIKINLPDSTQIITTNLKTLKHMESVTITP